MRSAAPLSPVLLLIALLLSIATSVQALWGEDEVNHKQALKLYKSSHTGQEMAHMGSYVPVRADQWAGQPVEVEWLKRARQDGVMYIGPNRLPGPATTYFSSVVRGRGADDLFATHMHLRQPRASPPARASSSLSRSGTFANRLGLGLQDHPASSADMDAIIFWKHMNGETIPLMIDYVKSSDAVYKLKDLPDYVTQTVIDTPVFRAYKM